MHTGEEWWYHSSIIVKNYQGISRLSFSSLSVFISTASA